jgi:hypothetical protein
MKSILPMATILVAVASVAAAQTASPPGTSSTPSVPPAGMPGTAQTATSARLQIEASGYTDIKDLKRQSDGSWRARATKSSEEVAVSVDSTGTVTQISQ